MAREWRRRLRRGVMYSVTAGLLMAPTFGLEADGRDAAARLSPRVRSTHPVIVAMLKEASARSATFRELVGGIERTDGIIYVEPGVCLHGARACLSLSISGGSGFRILR